MNSKVATTYTDASSLKVYDDLVINKHPCRIISVKYSKTGKDNNYKCHFVGIDWFTNKRYKITHLSTDIVEIPITIKIE